MQEFTFAIAEPIFVTVEFPTEGGVSARTRIDAAEVDAILFESQQTHGEASPENYRVLRKWFAEKLGRSGDAELIGLNQVADLAELCVQASTHAAEERKKKLERTPFSPPSTPEFPTTTEDGASEKNPPGSPISEE